MDTSFKNPTKIDNHKTTHGTQNRKANAKQIQKQKFKECFMMSRSNNKNVVPEARAALDKFKMRPSYVRTVYTVTWLAMAYAPLLS